MANILALRVRTPDSYAVPAARLAELGVQGVETSWPDGASADDVLGMVEPHGIRVTSLSVQSKLTEDDFLAPYEEGAARAESVGCGVIFTSLKREDMPMQQAADRLRQIGEAAAKHGVRVAMETHPDLCHNGDEALATMQAVNHPNLGINFDTANIYYYNDGTSTMAELQKIQAHVVSVHLKDTFGGFKSPDFPVFGQGVVDFTGVYDLLGARGFQGPFTMELEGKLTYRQTEDEQAQIIAACVDHLRSLGKV